MCLFSPEGGIGGFAMREKRTKALIEAGRFLMEKGLTWGSAGNLSARLDENTLLITASGTRLDQLRAEDFAVCDLQTGATQGPKPSKEWPVHAAVYAAHEGIGAVLHASPFYSTLVSCTGEAIPNNLFVENMFYLENVKRVPYCHPGSQALAEEVQKAAPKATALLLEHHGVLTYERTVEEALGALEVLEATCRMLCVLKGSGLHLQGLPQEQVEDFLCRSGYKPRREWGR